MKELFYSDDSTPTKPVVKALLIFPFLLFMVFCAGAILVVLVISLAFIKSIRFFKSLNNNPILNNTFTTTVFNEYVVRELLCDVLRNNAVELGVMAPKTVADITPTEYTVLQTVNGITIARFIVAHSSCEEEDFDTFLSLLNSKISQQLQLKYPDCVLLYNDMKVVTVFNVDYDLYHNGYFSIDIMVVDNDIKYAYLQRLNYQKAAARTAVDSSNLNDKDF